MTKLSRYFSRQGYPLFFCYVWSQSELKGLPEWLGDSIQNVLVFRERDVDKVIVWYDLSEIDKIREAIGDKIKSDDTWFGSVREAFNKHWKYLKPFADEEKLLSSVDDLKNYYEVWLRWWSPMAIFFEIPNIESLPQDIRDIALKDRKDTEEFSDSGDEAIETFFRDHYPSLAPIWGMMTPEEMFRADSLSDDDIAQIRQREHGWALLNGELLRLDELSGKLSELEIKLEEEKVKDNVEEIKGQPASTGHAKGIVKLVLESHHIGELKEGEVLVTEMTTPEFVPAMKKAVAIVTDEGGVTCHAAIVSRELGRPCIIGTKIATQVLKDGDEVEVDADSGVVKILK